MTKHRTRTDSMNVLAGTEGLTFEHALSVFADSVLAEREAKAEAQGKEEQADKPAKPKPKVKKSK